VCLKEGACIVHLPSSWHTVGQRPAEFTHAPFWEQRMKAKIKKLENLIWKKKIMTGT
jgi:hypothetical protein